MARAVRKLRVEFATAEAFAAEYDSNLANGGVFVATRERFELREMVRVELALAYARPSLTLDGEVVHCVPPELARSGATPGVAIQLSPGVPELRALLAPLLGRAPDGPTGKRDARRFPARVAAEIEGEGGCRVCGHTRNLSSSGALVSLAGDGMPVGQRVSLTLEHPLTGDRIQVEGRVARIVPSQDGQGAVAVGVHFDPAAPQREDVDRFIQELRQAEHARRLGGISGTLQELGVETLIAMFGRAAAQGTLALRRMGGEDEGVIGFEGGMLRFVRQGTATGLKALVRCLGWSQGSFEYHARLDPVPFTEPPLHFEAALLEGLRQIDELSVADLTDLDPTQGLERVAQPQTPPTPVEAAVLELAGAGFPLGRMLDIIPQPDPEILRAVRALLDAGVVKQA